MATLGSLVIELGASVVTLQSDFGRALGITDKFVNDIQVSLGKIGTGANFSGVSDQVKGLSADFLQLQNVVGAAFGASLGIGGLKEVEQLADDYQTVSNRIRTTTSDAQRLIEIQSELFDISQATARSYDDSAKTYQRIEQAIEGAGKSQIEAQQQALAVTKTLNEEIIVSGASAGEASRAIMDLVHGLSGGEIQARQFNQVMRQMPDLAKQIADGLGVSTKQLEAMVHAGLPAQVLLTALGNQAGVIDDKFNALPKTFAQTWTVLGNSVEQYVGQAAQASAATDLLKTAILGVSNNIGAIATGAEAVAAAMAVWVGGRALQGVGALAQGLKDATLAQGAYRTATILSAEADIAKAEADANAARLTIGLSDATILHTEKINDARIAEALALEQTIAGLQQEAAAMEKHAAIGVLFADEQKRLTVVQKELTASTAELTLLQDKMTASLAKMDLAELAGVTAADELAAAQARLGVAQKGLSVAQAEATTIMGVMSRAGAGLFALIGGWPTVILAAGAGLYYLATAENTVEQESDKLSKIIDDLVRAHGALSPAMEKTSLAAYAEAQAMLQAAQANQKFIEQNFAASAESGGEAAMVMGQQLGRATDDAEKLAQRMNDLAGQILKAKLAAAGNWLKDFLNPNIDGALAQIAALSDSIDKETAHFEKQSATYKMGQAAIVEYDKAQELAKLSIGKTSDQVAILSTELDKAYAKDIAAAKAVDAKTAAYKENTKELTAQQKALRDYQSDMLKISDLEQQLASGLSGPYEQALKDYQKQINLINDTWTEATVAGKASDQLLDQLGRDATAAATHYDLLNQKLHAQHDLLSASNVEIAMQNALWGVAPQDLDATRAAIEAYNHAIDTMTDLNGVQYTSLEALGTALDNQIPKYQANKQAINDVAAAQKQWEAVQKEFAGIASSGLDSVGKSIADFATGGIKSWHDFGQSLENDTKQFIAAIISEFLKLEVFNGIINDLFGLKGAAALPTFESLAASGGGALNAVSGGGISNLLGGAVGNVKDWIGGLFGGSAGVDLGGAGVLAGGTGGVDALSALTGGDFAEAAGGIATNAGTTFGAAAGSSLLGTLGPLLGAFSAGSAIGGTAGGIGLAAAAYFVPVIGWIAGVASLINSLTGGDVFGTSYKPTGVSKTDISAGGSGASIDDIVQEHKHGALFSSGSYKDVSQGATADQSTAINQAFAAEQASLAAAAKLLGTTVSDSITGTWEAITDKTGKIVSQTTTILGQKFSEDAQHFWERITADNELAMAGTEAQTIAAQWQSSADDLAQGTAFLIQAEADIAAGHALVQGETLTQLTAFVQGMQQQGETLAQTYVRVSVETTAIQTIFSNLGVTTGKTGEALVTFDDQLSTMAGGLDKLAAAFQTYYGEFYSQAEQQAATQKQLHDSVTAQFSAIGEDPTESLAKFRTDFEAALPSLTPAQVLQWLSAGDALYKFDQAMGTTSDQVSAAADAQAKNQAAYNDFIKQFSPLTIQTTAFESSLLGLNDSLVKNIAQANALAIAAGQQGASAQDVANIIEQSTAQSVAALQTFETQVQQLAGSLYGTNLDKLKQQLADDQAKAADNGPTSYYWSQQAASVQAQIDAANAQIEAAQRLTDASTLLQDFGQIGGVTGQTLEQIAQQFGVPLDKLASDLGVSQDSLDAAFKHQEDLFNAAVGTAANTKSMQQYLADILAQLQGQSLPYGASAFQADVTGTNVAAGGKLGGPTKAGGAPEVDVGAKLDTVTATVAQGTSQSNSDLTRLLTATLEQNDLLRQMLGRMNTSSYAPGPRTIRTTIQNA